MAATRKALLPAFLLFGALLFAAYTGSSQTGSSTSSSTSSPTSTTTPTTSTSYSHPYNSTSTSYPSNWTSSSNSSSPYSSSTYTSSPYSSYTSGSYSNSSYTTYPTTYVSNGTTYTYTSTSYSNPSSTYKCEDRGTEYACCEYWSDGSSRCETHTYHTDYCCKSNYADTYAYPTYSYPTESYYSRPYEQPPVNQNYQFELIGQTLYQDVNIYTAERVLIRDSIIHGRLNIGWSANVLVERSKVAGDVFVDQSSNVIFQQVDVSGHGFGFAYTTDFQVYDSNMVGMLGCYQCVHGVYKNLRVGGTMEIVESTDIQTENVQEGASYTYYQPPPEASVPRIGMVAARVENSILQYTHRKEGDRQFTTDVKVDMEAITAKASLHLASEDKPDEVALDLESRFEKLIEFEDRDGNGAYDLGDLVVREFLIEELPVEISQTRLAGDAGWRGEVRYLLPDGGVLALIFKTRDADADKTKIDIEIRNYPYSTGASQLATQIRLEFANEWIIEEGASEDRLIFDGRGFDGFFSWVKSAEADGRTTDVIAQVLEEHKTEKGEREIVLFLSYARATNIVHDPSIGILETQSFADAIALPPLGNILVYGSTLVAALVVLWAFGQARRRTE